MGLFKTSITILDKRDEIKFLLEASGYEYTRSGISRYQKEHGLPASGTVDFITYERLKMNRKIIKE